MGVGVLKMKIYFDPERKKFLNGDLEDRYRARGKWPETAVLLTDSEYNKFQTPAPSGKVLGADSDGRPEWQDAPLVPLDDIAAKKRGLLEGSRKLAESEGVDYKGVRYAGDPGNRQALMEALDLAEATGQTLFSSWKDSDGEFHTDHPVEDVRQALLAVASRRSQLIAREGHLNAQIDTALEAGDRTALEAIDWTEM